MSENLAGLFTDLSIVKTSSTDHHENAESDDSYSSDVSMCD